MALTKRDIDQLRHDPNGPGIQLHPVGDLPGFAVRVYPSGKKSFILRYRPEGSTQPKLHTIGQYGVLTLQQARELAIAALGDTKRGGDPQEKRRKSRQGESVKDLAAAYMARHAKPQKKTWAEDQRRIDKYVVPALGGKKIAEVKRADVARLHQRIGERAPYEANRVLALVATMFGKAHEWGLLEEMLPNPATRIQPFKEKSRDRWVKPDELPALWSAIEEESDIYVRAAFKLLLFTGMRRNEMLRLRWKDVDFSRREIRLPDTKAGRPHVVPLSNEALEILRGLPRQLGNAYVFPGRVPGAPLTSVSKSWRRVRARFWLSCNPEEAVKLREQAVADVHARSKHAERSEGAVESRLLALAEKEVPQDEVVRLHDLRRTTGAMMATSGTSVAVVGKVLNHSTPSSTAVYARIAEEVARDALEEHGAQVRRLVSGE